MDKNQNSKNKNRKTLSYEEKFKIMYKYLMENNAFESGIRARTKFENFPIGQWQSLMRTTYYKGKLELDEVLEGKLLEYGILRKEKERETATPLTWEEKFQIMDRYFHQNDKTVHPINENTVFEGYPIGVWQRTLRHLFYSDKLTNVTPELEKKFFEYGILRVEKKKTNGSRAKYTFEEKFNIMHRYLSENNAFKEGIHQDTVFEGEPIGVWQDYMRQRYYKGKLKITPELEEILLGYGILKKDKITKKKTKTSKEVSDTKEQKQQVVSNSDSNDEVQELINQILAKQELIRQQQGELDALRTRLNELTEPETEL